jgi:hypothetical protein
VDFSLEVILAFAFLVNIAGMNGLRFLLGRHWLPTIDFRRGWYDPFNREGLRRMSEAASIETAEFTVNLAG